MSPSEWPPPLYPPWAHGAGYILSSSLAREIGCGGALMSLRGKMLHLEDVSTGVWVEYLRKNLHKEVDIIHDAR